VTKLFIPLIHIYTYKYGDLMKTKLTITINEDTLKKFRKTCQKYGYKMSTKIEILIKDFMENGEKR